MSLRFVKTEAAGNDFVLVDFRDQPLQDAAELAVRVCDRHLGVGADGLMTLETRPSAPPLVRMYNPDGTEDFCGNGMCCVAGYLLQSDGASDNRVTMRSPRGRHEAVVEPLARGGYRVAVALVTPEFEPSRIPVRVAEKKVLRYPLEVAGRTWPISCVSVGTAHTLIFDSTEPADDLFARLSPLIERHPLFPERTSVLWCRVDGRDRIRMRIWERGVGETYSCGTGACAAAVIGRALALTGDRAAVITRGGVAHAEWDGEGPVRLIASSRIVYAGTWRPL